jgi:hypothetical protein
MYSENMTTQTVTIAETIRQQIGVSTFMELGAHDLRATPDSLRFTVRADNGRKWFVRVKLDTGSDTYTVSAAPTAIRSRATFETRELVYWDSLRDVLRSIGKR